MTRSERVFRALLHAYSRSTREASGEDMVQLFADRLRDAGSPVALTKVWLETIADVAVTAPRERLARRRVPQLAEGPALDGRRPLAADLRVAALPLLLAAVVAVVRPGFLAPLFDSRASVGGLPFGGTMLFLTAVLAGIGVLGARRSHDLADPEIQVNLLAWLLAPIPLLLFASLLFSFWPDLPALVAYAWTMTLFVLAARFRVLMLALSIPFVAWLLFGPVVVPVLIMAGGQTVGG